MADRPEYFDLGTNSQLAQGLVFAGLGRFSGSTHYHDSSLYGNRGTLTNMDPATDWVWDSFLGRWVLDFDGANDYVSLPAINFAGAFSISLWFKFAGTPDNTGMIGNYDTPSSRAWCIAVGNTPTDTAGTIQFLYQRTGSTYTAGDRVITTGTYNDSRWHHCTCRFVPSTFGDIWIDGVLAAVNTTSVPTAVASNTYGTRIASYDDGFYFAGQLTDQLIHDGRAISTSEIQQLANPSNTMLSGLVLPPKRRLWAAVVGGAPATTIRWPWQYRRHRRMAGVS